MRHPASLLFLVFAAAACHPATAQLSALPSAPLPALAEAQQSTTPPPSPVTPQPDLNASPQLTLFPHSANSPWWISGQANVILQGKPGFHSPYQGSNSLDSAPEYKTSLVETLFLGWQPHHHLRYDTDLLLDVESAGGRGLGQALGLAGFTNLDVVRNPDLGTAPYLARAEIHQTLGLTDQLTESDRSAFSLAAQVPVRRVEVRVGKMSLPDLFDVNDIASDSHLQFMNWTVDNNGAWDYAADTRGYTVGGSLEYDDHAWSARYGVYAMPTVANGNALDWAFSRSHGEQGELDWRHSFLSGRHGTTRILTFVNHANMGDYRQTVRAYRLGIDPSPDLTRHRRFGALKYGFGWNHQQEITANLRIASRFGWNDDREESFAYTEVAQTVLIAADYAGTRWHRPTDKIGVAFVSNAIKKDHQNYLRDGGLGFLLGDGTLRYGRENIVETYYTCHAWKGLFFALDGQHINNPGYNRDRGPVWVGALRGHIDF